MAVAIAQAESSRYVDVVNRICPRPRMTWAFGKSTITITVIRSDTLLARSCTMRIISIT